MRTGEGCAGAKDIAIYQVNASSLPSVVLAYKVDVINVGTGGDHPTQKTSMIGEGFPALYVVLPHHRYMMWD